MGLPTTGTRAAQTNSISCSEKAGHDLRETYIDMLTQLVWSAVSDGCPTGCVEYLCKLEDVNRRSGGHEEHTQGYAHLVKPVQLAILGRGK